MKFLVIAHPSGIIKFKIAREFNITEDVPENQQQSSKEYKSFIENLAIEQDLKRKRYVFPKKIIINKIDYLYG